MYEGKRLYPGIIFLLRNSHCVKSVCIRSFSGPYFPTFGLNTERYGCGVSLRIQSEEKYGPEKFRIRTLFT